jgi:pimeloyl-ACP methyl ester carboxylesterase
MVVLIISILGVAAFFLIMDGACAYCVKKGYKRLETFQHKEIELSCGKVTYVDNGAVESMGAGESRNIDESKNADESKNIGEDKDSDESKGDAILSIHGICGGYDQGIENIAGLAKGRRIIAPSRFGYLGSSVPPDPTPKEQAKVFAELLDALGVEQVYLAATSAGGTVAIRFALDYPERTRGLILLSSIAPYKEKPRRYQKYMGPAKSLCSNFGMWMSSRSFGSMLDMEPDTIYAMLPVDERRAGIINDASVTNPDMAKNFDDYPIEDLQAPTLIFQAKDIKKAKFERMEQAVSRFPDCRFVVFETGGPLMIGSGEEIEAELDTFFHIDKH